MIYEVERIGNCEPYKYRVFYNYYEMKREYIGSDKLPSTVKEFISNSNHAETSGNGWVTKYTNIGE